MRRVLVLNQYALPKSEGGGTRHVDLFGRLRGWQTSIVAAGRNHYSQEIFSTHDTRFQLVNVPRYDGNGASRVLGWFVYALKALAHGMTHGPIDVVYASSPHMLSPVAGWCVAKCRGAKFILEIRDLWPESLVDGGAVRRGSAVHRALARLERWTARRADHVVVVTAGWEDHFRDLGVARSRLTVIPNGSELEDFAVAEGREELRDRHQISGFTAIYAGAHGPANDIDGILDAAAKLGSINFLLVGAGQSKGAAVARKRADRLNNVEFRDAVPKSDLPSLLAACDAGIHSVSPLPVLALGMSPNKLFDYLAAGLPIASNAGLALRNVTADGECGRIGGSGDLASCLDDVAGATSQQRSAWGHRGQDLVRERHSRAAAAARLENVLDSLAGGSDSRPPSDRARISV